MLLPKLVLRGKEKQVKNQKDNKRQEPSYACAFHSGRMRKGIFLLISLHPFLCFAQASFTIHVLFIFMTNIYYYKYFTVPNTSFPGFLISVFCILNFCFFMYYLPGTVVCTL